MTPMEALHDELATWFQEFIERNSVTERTNGIWKCQICEMEAAPSGDFSHAEDCEILSAQRILDRLRKGKG